MSKADQNSRAEAELSPDPAEPRGAAPPAAEDLTALAAAVDELRDKYLRAAAETENVRRRAEREIADARAYGIAAFAREVIGVADNLARALDAIDSDARAGAEGTLKALLDGVELTQRELQKVLEKQGVRRLDPKGERFDPNFHQAMFEVPDTEAPPGTVVQVVQTGYAIGDRVLRPALVGVAKGGIKESAAPETVPD
jgi:molecular chaperone GrpE